MEEPKKKRATQKAVAAFRELNHIDNERVLNTIESLFPDKFVLSEDLANSMVVSIFREYDTLTDEEFVEAIKSRADLYQGHTKEAARQLKLTQDKSALIHKIAQDAQIRDVRLSEYPEWNDEMYEYMKESCGHWSGVIENDQLMLGRAFNKCLSYYEFGYNQYLPFHCYMIDEKEVLFTKKRLQWDEANQKYIIPEKGSSNSGCFSIILGLIVIVALSLFII